ncbi:MAG: UDP-N-acetylmuramoyl-L-alanyl-D-glutamate--2,6-diaminopimelate ligase [Gemmatimonadota bacterium]
MSGDARELATLATRLEAEGLLLERRGGAARIGGVADDSRRVAPGDLFCAWAGSLADAHDYVPAAVAAGAAAVLVERASDTPVPQLVVRDGRRAAATVAAAFYGDPAERLRVVGVTGTNGKTSTVWVLRHLLEGRWPTATIGTLGAFGRSGPMEGASLTTPGPVELARTLRVLVDQGVAAVAMEVSSHALHQGRVHAVRFDVGVFINLTRDHLDYHGTVEEYTAAKRLLVDHLKPEGTAVVNAQDPAWAGIPAAAPRALTFAIGTDTAADVTAARLDLGPAGSSFALVCADGESPVQLPLVGRFNVENALGAAAACLALGFSRHEVADRLAGIPQVPGRLERIAEAPCPIYRDYAHTPAALAGVLEALRTLTPGRLLVVFGAGGDRDRGKRAEMGRVASALADLAIVTSDNPRTEDPAAIVDDITAGMSAGFERVVERRAAIRRALELAGPEDVILLAGKGHETYQIVGTEKRPFDERDVVAELTAARGA